jgi:hypothetical protein
MKEERCTDNINKGKIANNLYCALLELKKKIETSNGCRALEEVKHTLPCVNNGLQAGSLLCKSEN